MDINKFIYYIKDNIDMAKELNEAYMNLRVEVVEKIINDLEKKEKVINKMATYISGLDIEEDICEKIENENCDKMDFDVCEKCIIEYFSKKEG